LVAGELWGFEGRGRIAGAAAGAGVDREHTRAWREPGAWRGSADGVRTMAVRSDARPEVMLSGVARQRGTCSILPAHARESPLRLLGISWRRFSDGCAKNGGRSRHPRVVATHRPVPRAAVLKRPMASVAEVNTLTSATIIAPIGRPSRQSAMSSVPTKHSGPELKLAVGNRGISFSLLSRLEMPRRKDAIEPWRVPRPFQELAWNGHVAWKRDGR
jgi:hypothetical protein